MFRNLDDLVEAAIALGPARIAVAAGHDPDVIESLQLAREMGLAEAVLVGDRKKIEPTAAAAGLRLGPGQLIHQPDESAAALQAIELVREGAADLLMKGKINTSVLIRAVLNREKGLRTGRQLSQVIVFQVPGIDRLMIMTDAAINLAPELAQKAEICRNAIHVAHALGIEEPNVALLCALEFVNPAMPATVDAAALTMMNRRGQLTGAYLEGPIALDVPMSRFAADRKGIETPLVENTDIFIAPDIEAANILYRAILYMAGGESGGIVVGAKVPLILLSRAETPETKIRSIAIGRLVAQYAAG
ncbi:MAG: bifunctional enoyl-CoA hydratase/phosphate acetyltransferase [Candidatus Aminicenantes bacterium]|nr:bifunctional enoyl-CoA hydratase/phosphate acetyltransferase [Candidatus Aminicenantes bacterium]